jgi:hypothetical protein
VPTGLSTSINWQVNNGKLFVGKTLWAKTDTLKKVRVIATSYMIKHAMTSGDPYTNMAAYIRHAVRCERRHVCGAELMSTAGTLQSGAQTGEIRLRNHKSDWSSFNEVNDYSFDATKTTYMDRTKATLYQNGVKVWGVEPS